MALRIAADCPSCNRDLVRRRGSNGDFLGCSGFPRCKFTEPYEWSLEQLNKQVVAYGYDSSWFRDAISEVKKTVRDVILFAHPDRWPAASNVTNGVTARLNALMDKL